MTKATMRWLVLPLMLGGLVGNAYLRAVRSDDDRLRGLTDGYSEASGTITARAAQLWDQLLERCG